MRRGYWIGLSAAALLMVGGGVWMAYGQSTSTEVDGSGATPSATTAATSAPTPRATTATSGPTPTDVPAGPGPTPAPLSSDSGPTTGPAPEPTALAAVDVVMTFSIWNAASGQAEVGGYVSNLVEESGTCTATFTQGSRTVEVAGGAAPDATTTSCVVTAPGAGLGTGSWQVALSYLSGSSSGKSTSMPIEVP
jgi:hypothetical protein